jgi:hypothetical protein
MPTLSGPDLAVVADHDETCQTQQPWVVISQRMPSDDGGGAAGRRTMVGLESRDLDLSRSPGRWATTV